MITNESLPKNIEIAINRVIMASWSIGWWAGRYLSEQIKEEITVELKEVLELQNEAVMKLQKEIRMIL